MSTRWRRFVTPFYFSIDEQVKSEQYKRGDLLFRDGGKNTCRIDFIFYYDSTVHYDDMHLLEHVILDPYRFMPSHGKMLGQAVQAYQYFNGMTTSTFLNYNIKSSNKDINDILPYFLSVTDDDLEIDKRVIEQELTAIAHEDEKSPYGDYYNSAKFYDFGDKFPQRISPTTDALKALFQKTIQNNRVTAMVRGNSDAPEVQQLLDSLRNRLDSKDIAPTDFPSQFVELPYTPIHELIPANPEGNDLYMFFSLKNRSFTDFCEHALFFFFIREGLYELIRRVEQSDYSLKKGCKTFFYAREVRFEIRVKSSTNDLLQLMREQFHKDKEDFAFIKKKCIRFYTSYMDHYNAFYEIIQSYYFSNGTYYSLPELCEVIDSIDYDRFQKVYQQAIARISLMSQETYYS